MFRRRGLARAARGQLVARHGLVVVPATTTLLALLALSASSLARSVIERHARSHVRAVRSFVISARGGWVVNGNGEGIYVPPGVMARSGYVTITPVGHGVYDFHIDVPWHGTVGITMPLKSGRDVIVHDLGGTWVPEESKRGQRLVWVTQLSLLTTLFTGIDDAHEVYDFVTCAIGHFYARGLVQCAALSGLKYVSSQLAAWIIGHLPTGCADNLLLNATVALLLEGGEPGPAVPWSLFETLFGDPTCAPAAGDPSGFVGPSGPPQGAPQPPPGSPTHLQPSSGGNTYTLPPPPGTFAHHVYHTCANGVCGLRVHSAVDLASSVLRVLTDGTQVNIVCQTVGDRTSGVDGSNTDIWDALYGGGYVSDYYVDTPGTLGALSPPIPRCTTLPPPPPATRGSATIAAAPDLPIGQPVASGWVEQGFVDGLDYGEFWRVTMNAGDKLTLDATETACDQGAPLGLEVFAPWVTDYTARTANTAASGGADAGEFAFVAPLSGTWTLFVNGCHSTSYQLMARLASFASTSASNAASTIAAAPDLPIGALVASGWVEPGFADGLDYGEFWRVPMNAGDKLTLDATETGCDEGAALGFEIFAPSVTDFTVRNANAGASGGADGHGEFTFVAPSSGPWILFVNGCDSTSYDVLASMKERTLISIQAPHLGQPHARIVIRGQIASPSNGRVVLRLLTHQRWVLVATTTISLDGRFRFVVRAPGPGSYRYQVLYRGDSSHVASSRVVTVALR